MLAVGENFSNDLYKVVFRKQATNRELILVSLLTKKPAPEILAEFDSVANN